MALSALLLTLILVLGPLGILALFGGISTLFIAITNAKIIAITAASVAALFIIRVFMRR